MERPISFALTIQEAQTVMNALANAPMPYVITNPLLLRIARLTNEAVHGSSVPVQGPTDQPTGPFTPGVQEPDQSATVDAEVEPRITHQGVETLKMRGDYRAAGRLAFEVGEPRSYGQHYGTDVTLASARAMFLAGYDSRASEPEHKG